MCDYSLEHYSTRKAEVGDKLIIGPRLHGFMTVRDSDALNAACARGHATAKDVCMTCLYEDGIVLKLVTPGGTAYTATYERRETRDGRDWLVPDGDKRGIRIGELAHGTTAEVISIPSVTVAAYAAEVAAKEAEAKNLDKRLGLDKINAEVNQDPEPAGVVSAYRRLVNAVRGH